MYQLKLLFVIVIIFSVIDLGLSQTNYCSSNLCNGKKHIACNNKGDFAPICSKNAKVIRLTPKMLKRILNKHNALRNHIASGKLRGYKAAVRMATLRWSPELAKLAAYNVKQCKIQHDKCRNTRKFSFAGQNIAQISWSGRNRAIGTIITQQIQSWFNEYKKCSMAVINKMNDVSKCGHFTAVVNEKNIAVGCAILRQTKGRKTTQLMTCNYAYTNVIGKPVYRSGRTASKCRTGRNRRFKALCSPREKYQLKSTKF
ncbi:venom allergen-1-like [Cochliomyia hominivorax]